MKLKLLTEMPHFRIQRGAFIDGKEIELIDFRYEKYQDYFKRYTCFIEIENGKYVIREPGTGAKGTKITTIKPNGLELPEFCNNTEIIENSKDGSIAIKYEECGNYLLKRTCCVQLDNKYIYYAPGSRYGQISTIIPRNAILLPDYWQDIAMIMFSDESVQLNKAL